MPWCEGGTVYANGQGLGDRDADGTATGCSRMALRANGESESCPKDRITTVLHRQELRPIPYQHRIHAAAPDPNPRLTRCVPWRFNQCEERIWARSLRIFRDVVHPFSPRRAEFNLVLSVVCGHAGRCIQPSRQANQRTGGLNCGKGGRAGVFWLTNPKSLRRLAAGRVSRPHKTADSLRPARELCNPCSVFPEVVIDFVVSRLACVRPWLIHHAFGPSRLA
jgi:hypothetical protein